MKFFNEKMVRFFSKFVNLERAEIVTWCNPTNFEKKIDNLCYIPDSSVVNSTEIVVNNNFEICCNKNMRENETIKALRCACGFFRMCCTT